MNKIITLLFLLISFSSRAQPGCDYPRPSREELLKAGVCVLTQPSREPQKKPQSNQVIVSCGYGLGTPELKKILINDELDGSPITGATVAFVTSNRKDTIFESSELDGSVNTDQLRPRYKYDVIVSSSGYLPIRKKLYSSTDRIDTIPLTRNIIECKPVVVAVVCRWIRCCKGGNCYSRVKGIKPEETKKKVKIKTMVGRPTSIRFFPNPVACGSEITIETGENNVEYVQLTDLLGRVLLHKKNEHGKSRIMKISLDPRWAPGTYFLQAFYENSQVSASGKIIIQ